jgi:exopolysaccharide biosynthesis polyprenyl glycosylphosphotransferase
MFADEFLDRRGASAAFLAKRLLDVSAAGLGVLVLSPLLVCLCVLIRLDSRGPIFFRQQRLGLGGQTFRIWKFRTMVCDAERRLAELEALNESKGGVLFKLKTDPRVTRIGHWLRRTSLDELPQLLNVLQGHMSLVGPRPLQLRDCTLAFQADSARFEHRHTVLPGVTGLWQVSGRSEVGFEQMLRLDEQYIRNWSLQLDLEILLKTVAVVLRRKGAY